MLVVYVVLLLILCHFAINLIGEKTLMGKKKMIFQTLELVKCTTNPTVLAQLSEKTSDIQELSEEALSHVYGGAVEQTHDLIVYCRQPD
jgi:hypothetical protein